MKVLQDTPLGQLFGYILILISGPSAATLARPQEEEEGESTSPLPTLQQLAPSDPAWDPAPHVQVEQVGQPRKFLNSNVRTFVEAKISLNIDSEGMSLADFLVAGEKALSHGLGQLVAIPDGVDDPDRGIRITVQNPNLYGGYRSTKSRPLEELEMLIQEAASILSEARQSERDLGTSDGEEQDIRLEDTTFIIIRQGTLANTRTHFETKGSSDFTEKETIRLGAKPPRLHVAKRSKQALADFAALKRCCINPLEPRYHLVKMAKRYHNLCLPAALVLGKFLADHPQESITAYHRSLRQFGSDIRLLMRDIGLEKEQGPLALPQQLLDQFYTALGGEYHIICTSPFQISLNQSMPQKARPAYTRLQLRRSISTA